MDSCFRRDDNFEIDFVFFVNPLCLCGKKDILPTSKNERKMKNYIILVLLSLFLIQCQTETELGKETLGEFAPPDAYEEGSKHPYYGSENEWNQRFFYEHNKRFYKRRGQRQMLDIVEGRYQEAADYCQELLKTDPKDLESLYNLAVAQAHLGYLDAAIATVKRAVDSGLPFSRFLVGPRNILNPLTESDAFKKIAMQYNISLLHGPMLGCLTDHSVRIWVRTLEESEIQIQLSESDKMTNPLMSKIVNSQEKHDYTALIDIEGLEPATQYYYNVIINGHPSFNSNLPVFQTYPVKGKRARFSVGFGGGAGYVPPNERMWSVISSHKPSGFLFMGDNVYINMPEQPNGVHYYTYYRRQARSEFKRLVSSTASYAIWDDHDASTDDVWMGPYKNKPVWKLPLLEVFQQNWNNPGYGDPEWPGCWFDFSIADVDFFMLDGRFYRTNPFLDNPTMLGPVQKKWLLEKLKKSQAKIKVIASPVPWSLASKGEARDTWNGFKKERKEIFDFLAENKINGVILLSADRHRSDAWKIEHPDIYPLYEFSSSRLTNAHFHELMPNALFGYNEKQSFGFLTFDTSSPEPGVTYQIYSIDNELINTLNIKLSEISYE
jgi:alkaline phosphatase D